MIDQNSEFAKRSVFLYLEDLDPEAMWIASTSTTVRSLKKRGEVGYPTTVRTS
jgi:hypothetical protein